MAEPPAEKRRKLHDGADRKDKQAIVVLSKPGSGRRRNCPYLDTINRNVLDFDFEKLCSVSLSKINVYACLVCGKYFQGRGTNTHAYTHSVQVSHHVFLNLQTLRFYCLPDNYEIVDSSLDDITYVLRPTFTKGDIIRLDLSDRLSRAYDGTTYLPGIVGLNNIKANDYCNVVLQASAHVSPHEMLQAVVLCSKKRFQITEQGDPIDFLSWFLNSLHLALNGTQKRSSSIVYKTFRGGMNIYSRKVVPVEHTEAERRAALRTAEYQEKVENTGFMYLTADLPAQPLFKDELRENIIPQVPLFTILSKFNGTSEKEAHLLHRGSGKWYEMQDLHVTEILPQMITLSEALHQDLGAAPPTGRRGASTYEPRRAAR
ncbi:hypothetical protein HPB47_009945 [Ixodes persulcatus]|uniref:Uncharacterized protein n=1 Tax=Ixodes persulcatus TaxID=34615 RepID=A0AC60P0L1_IXOPE|nr:hypothetical protein HPB47_009945 [Ixodes persulcatus]